ILTERIGDATVQAGGIKLGDEFVFPFVNVLAPHGHAQFRFWHGAVAIAKVFTAGKNSDCIPKIGFASVTASSRVPNGRDSEQCSSTYLCVGGHHSHEAFDRGTKNEILCTAVVYYCHVCSGPPRRVLRPS